MSGERNVPASVSNFSRLKRGNGFTSSLGISPWWRSKVKSLFQLPKDKQAGGTAFFFWEKSAWQ